MLRKNQRHWLIGLVTLAVLQFTASIYVLSLLDARSRSWIAHRDLMIRGKHAMHALHVAKCPTGVTESDWKYAVGWATNAHGNCFYDDPRLDWSEYASFIEELERRVQRPATLELVEWIWDEVERISVDGKNYSAKYRPKRNTP